RACKPRRCLNVCLNATPYLMLCLGTRCSDSRFVTGTRRSNANYERIGGTTTSMPEQPLFELKDVRVTPHIATFGGTSYQIANIGSIQVVRRRKYNPFAIIIFLLGLGIFVAAMVKSRMTGLAEESFSMAATGIAVVIGSFLLQVMWPRRVYVLVLRMPDFARGVEQHRSGMPVCGETLSRQQHAGAAEEMDRARRGCR